MIIRSYNPIEGGPAIWLDETIVGDRQVSRLMRQLRQYPEGDGPIDIVIAGGGGRCSAGLEMFTALKLAPRRKRVTIFDAPSMSGVIAMAGDHIRIVEGGSIFLHHARIARDVVLNAADMRHFAADALRHLARGCEITDALHAEIFARRTGLSREKIADLRARETTLSACEALDLGFVDEIVPMRAA